MFAIPQSQRLTPRRRSITSLCNSSLSFRRWFFLFVHRSVYLEEGLTRYFYWRSLTFGRTIFFRKRFLELPIIKVQKLWLRFWLFSRSRKCPTKDSMATCKPWLVNYSPITCMGAGGIPRWRMTASISVASAGCCCKKSLAFSRPCPRRISPNE